MLSKLMTICALFAALAAGQTQSPVAFQYGARMLATEVTFQSGVPVLSNYQGGIMLQAWSDRAEVTDFVAFVGYRLAGSEKVLTTTLYFPKTPGSTHGSSSAVLAPGLDFTIQHIYVVGVKRQVAGGVMYPQPGTKYPQ